MSSAARAYKGAVSAAVAAPFAAFWVIAFALGEPPEFPIQYLVSAIMIGVVAALWVVAVRLCCRDWFARNESRLSTMDAPAQLLALAAALLPEDRRDWGAAMTAELNQVVGRAARWRFALGCMRTALLPPRSGGAPPLLVAALAGTATAIAGSAVGAALPAMRTFAVTFVAIIGALVTLAAARSRSVGLGVLWRNPLLAALGVLGVASCIGATVDFLIKNPAAAEHLPPIAANFFAVLLAGGLWLAIAPPRGLTTHRVACMLGVAAAAALGLGFVVTARMSVHTYGGPMIWTFFAPPPLFFLASAMAAAITRSFRAGIQTAVWAALVGALLVFALSLPEAMRRFAIDGRTLGDGESGYPIGVNLSGAIWGLVQIPIFGGPFGAFGAAVGRRIRGASPSDAFHAENPQ